MFVIEGQLRKHDLCRSRGLAADLNQDRDLNAPVGGEEHFFQQVHMERDFTAELIVEAQEKVYETQHLLLFALRKFPFEGKKERVTEKHILSLTRLGNIEPRLVPLRVDAAETGAVVPLDNVLIWLLFCENSEWSSSFCFIRLHTEAT
jgi:hypothetical protein